MMLPLRVRIGSIVFEGSGSYGDTGFFIEPDGFEGWESGAAVRREEILRPSAHGAFDVPGFLSPRVVSISGNIVAESARRRRHMRDQLIGLLADGQSGRLTVDEPGLTSWADVRLADMSRSKARGRDGETSRFQLQFWAPDPRKYGDGRYVGPSSDPIVLAHYGNFPSVPLLRVTGIKGDGYTISGPGGRQIVVTAPLEAADPHEIDMRTGALTVGGVRVMGQMPTFQPWSIPPGQRVTASVSGGVALRATVADTFI